MPYSPERLRADAVAIWTAGVEAVKPAPLVERAVADLRPGFESARHILVVGGGKAGAAMAAGLEAALADQLSKVVGLVNIPEPDALARASAESPSTLALASASGSSVTTKRIRLHHARPVGHNFPTKQGVAGVEWMLELLRSAGPDDVAICLLSGGGSALLPAPAEGITLADKQAVTAALHRSGATIGEMNAVRKHLSAVKGGRMAEAFGGRRLVSLIISDVVGDPLDVIASGPTAPDPTTFADALAVLARYRIDVPEAVIEYLKRGECVELPETPKALPPTVENRVIGSNAVALEAARTRATELGYPVVSLGSANAGEAVVFADELAHRVSSPNLRRPVCLLAGGETTVSLGSNPGKGGRNQELVLAVVCELGEDMNGVCVLSGGTDGEDGPTDAAGAVATLDTYHAILQYDAVGHHARHDAYPLFDRCGGLLRTGLTGTNVMDLQVILVT